MLPPVQKLVASFISAPNGAEMQTSPFRCTAVLWTAMHPFNRQLFERGIKMAQGRRPLSAPKGADAYESLPVRSIEQGLERFKSQYAGGILQFDFSCLCSIERTGRGSFAFLPLRETGKNKGSLLLRCPANVLGDKTPSSPADRCHSLPSLIPPPAAVGSLPSF